jgi:hypothetical protein
MALSNGRTRRPWACDESSGGRAQRGSTAFGVVATATWRCQSLMDHSPERNPSTPRYVTYRDGADSTPTTEEYRGCWDPLAARLMVFASGCLLGPHRSILRMRLAGARYTNPVSVSAIRRFVRLRSRPDMRLEVIYFATHRRERHTQ